MQHLPFVRSAEGGGPRLRLMSCQPSHGGGLVRVLPPARAHDAHTRGPCNRLRHLRLS
jgi:hypothetical protein